LSTQQRNAGAAATAGPVYVVDGDPEVLRSLRLLLGTLKLNVEVFPSAEAALPRILEAPPACLVCEVFLPGMSGTELQRLVLDRSVHFPVVMLATHADVPLAVEAMRLGAIDFIEKPIIDRVILARVREAVPGPGPLSLPEERRSSA
jgi:two-component system response regulator FixJ